MSDLEPELAPFEAIRELIGDEAAARLSARFGGRRFYVPRHPGPHHPLSFVVGHDAALKIAAEFACARLDIPLGAGKRARIVALREAGRSIAEIAAELICTERHVYYVLKEARDAGDDLDLFKQRG